MPDSITPPKQLGSRRDRIAYLIAAGLGIVVLVTARLLNPAASGVGTHEQLGLPPCSFHAMTGHGCAGCGLTTSFAHIARGQIGAAIDANPAALLLFALTSISIPFLLYRAARPVPLERYIESFWTVLALGLLVLSIFLTWLLRLVLGMV